MNGTANKPWRTESETVAETRLQNLHPFPFVALTERSVRSYDADGERIMHPLHEPWLSVKWELAGSESSSGIEDFVWWYLDELREPVGSADTLRRWQEATLHDVVAWVTHGAKHGELPADEEEAAYFSAAVDALQNLTRDQRDSWWQLVASTPATDPLGLAEAIAAAHTNGP